MAKGTHLATCGIRGRWGNRVGTSYAFTPREAYGLRGEPWFRFRNAETKEICRRGWAEPPPMSGRYFDVVPDHERPAVRSSTKTSGELSRCDLASWEGAAICWGRKSLCRLGATDYYQWFEVGDDYAWSPRGRLLKLNAAGRAVRREGR